MNFIQLLHQREALLRQARLANLAFAYARLSAYGERIACAGLRGTVTLQPPDPEADRFWPVLVSPDVPQSVLDEHFLDEDVLEFGEILAFLEDEGQDVEFTFAIESLPQRFLPALRRELEKAGVTPLGVAPQV